MDSSSKAKALGFSTLDSSPSALSRSPTVKSCIGSFSCFSELLVQETDKNLEKLEGRFLAVANGAPRSANVSRYEQQRKVEQLLLPPLMFMIVIPLLWYYDKWGSVQNLSWLAGDLSVNVWLECFAVLLFSLISVLLARFALPYFSFASKLQALYFLATALCKGSRHCRAFFLRWGDTAFASPKAKEKKNSSVTAVAWTIGSKSKLQKSKIYCVGAQSYSNGDVYEGEFYQGRCSGSGVYYYMNGKYEGDWVDGKFDGYGVETWSIGSRYRGQYRQGMRHGFGIYRFYTGDVYSGEWCGGQSHGNGVQMCEDGSRYVGEFKHGMKHGLGYYQFRNGDTYAGEYFEDKMHGYGIYHFKNGHQYEGSWHEGRKQGLGLYTFRNGETQGGHWHHSALETPSTSHSTLGSPSDVTHSKVLNVVQEARRSAAKALEVRRVDDEVKKAVAAANRTANAARVMSTQAVQTKNNATTFL